MVSTASTVRSPYQASSASRLAACGQTNTRRRVARQSKPLVQRQSTIHPMVEQRSVGKLVSSPKPPEAGAPKARLFTPFTAGQHKFPMQLNLDENHNPPRGLVFSNRTGFFFAPHTTGPP